MNVLSTYEMDTPRRFYEKKRSRCKQRQSVVGPSALA
ncbi:MAG: hypothetical protein ACI9KE_003195, partial [Polyangiales bacterium]